MSSPRLKTERHDAIIMDSPPPSQSSSSPSSQQRQHQQRQQQQQQQQQQQPRRLLKPPDARPRRRKESLDALLGSLSSWDLLYMRNRFRDGGLRLDGFAGLSELPPEVFASIVPHLRLQDVLNCYLVCKDWREAWVQGAVATALCRRFFPGLLELYGGDVPDRHELFLASAKRYLRKHFMSRSKRSFVSWDVGWDTDYFVNPQEAPAGRQLGDLRLVDFGFAPLTVSYSSGKVAWQPDNCHVIVDDLYTRERARFSFGVDFISGRPLQLQAVTDSLVILASSSPQFRDRHLTDNGQTITVFHLQYRRSKNVVLPGKFAQCYAQGDMVAFVTKQGHVVVWGWSDSAIELEIDHGEHLHQPNGWEKDLGGVPGVMFHPTDTDIVFAAWLNSPAPPDPRIHTIVVVKYEHGLPVRRYETSLSHPEYRRHPDSRHSCPAMRLTLSCQRMNAYGGYAVGIVQYVLHEEGAPWQDSDAKKNAEWLTICFNVLTESFAQNKYESHRRPHPPQVKHFDLCAWEDQFIITWFDEYLVSRHYSYGMQWLVASPVDEDASGCPRTTEVDARTRRQRSNVADYMLDIGFGRRIFVDNDFLIITTGQGFMVLSCNDEVDLPGVISRDANGVAENSKNPPWPPPGERIEPPRLPASWDTRQVTSLEKIPGISN
ncbi:cyclin-like f-box [Trichoderma cornu-damae]|uniref:Cyclin-like f-box n=1 Tax=Trichoderma cornu-damae TaxID=654480 RepID=A0A9P8QNC3_9HYPO|nr:cyclin-like f-box [Trichoderma cornu-damae]